MSVKSDTFISESFMTTDGMFCFQKVGRYYRLYDRDSGYSFLKEFISFHAMQDFMNEARRKREKQTKGIR